MALTPPHLVLQHIADSAFPSGTFGHSWGLENAIGLGWVRDAQSLFEWTQTAFRFSLFPLDGIAALRAHRLAGFVDHSRILELDAEVASFRPGAFSREASASLGRSILKAATEIYAAPPLVALENALPGGERLRLQQPVAWGFVCGALGIPLAHCVESLLLGTAKQWAQVAMRLIPIGQALAHRHVRDTMPLIAELVAAMPDDPESIPLASLTPGWDIAMMGHEALSARYFRS